MTDKDKDKDQGKARTRGPRASLPPDVAERIECLEQRITELETEKARRDRDKGVARRP